MLIDHATYKKNWYRYTWLTRERSSFVFGFAKEKTKKIFYWRGSIVTYQSKRKKTITLVSLMVLYIKKTSPTIPSKNWLE